MGAGHQKDQAMIRSLEFSALVPYSLEEGERLKMELMFNHDYVMEPPRNPNSMGFGEHPDW